MDSIDKIDIVLNYIIDMNNPPSQSDAEITKGLSIQLDYKELFEILHKLVKDGYVFSSPRSGGIAEYRSTFEGRMLKEDGGYKIKHKREIREANHQSSKTMAIVVGTSLAGIVGVDILFRWIHFLWHYIFCH